MTEAKKKLSSRNRHPIHFSRGRLVFSLFSIFTLLLVLLNAELAVSCMNDGLRLCVTTLIPSLFPFLVLSELIVFTEAVKPIGKLLSPPFRALFGVGQESACVLLLGWLCGFPIGTRCAVTLYRQGKIDRQELSHLLTFVNLPSSAFLIGTVGISLFSDRSFGIALYVTSLTSAILIGMWGHFVSRKKKTQSASASFVRISDRKAPSKRSIDAFTDAIGDSAIAMLRICAFVVFFSVMVGTLEHLVQALQLPSFLCTLLFGFFELTGGTARAATLPSPILSELLCMLFVGWSGLSVHFQMMSLCSEATLSYRPYFTAKAAHGLLNLLLWGVFRALFG